MANVEHELNLPLRGERFSKISPPYIREVDQAVKRQAVPAGVNKIGDLEVSHEDWLPRQKKPIKPWRSRAY
jgi:hypothetical protein